MKILVCGGRKFNDQKLLNETLNELMDKHDIQHVIHGGAAGADTLAGQWACKNQVNVVVKKAKWEKYGKSAGPIRNLKMIQLKPDLVVAFPGGKGTDHMCQLAIQHNVKLIRVLSPK